MKVLSCNINEGGYEFRVQATEEEVGNMIHIALSVLVEIGAIKESDQSYDVNLGNLSVEDMFRA